MPLNIFLSLYFVFKLCFFDFHVILQQKVARHGVYRKSLMFIVNMIVNFIIYYSGQTCFKLNNYVLDLSLIHISEPTRPLYISYAVFCLKKHAELDHYFLMIRRPPRSTHCISSAASDVYKRQTFCCKITWKSKKHNLKTK